MKIPVVETTIKIPWGKEFQKKKKAKQERMSLRELQDVGQLITWFEGCEPVRLRLARLRLWATWEHYTERNWGPTASYERKQYDEEGEVDL